MDTRSPMGGGGDTPKYTPICLDQAHTHCNHPPMTQGTHLVQNLPMD